MNYLLANAEQALLGMAGKARGNAEQNLYFEAMRELRLKRRSLADKFVPQVMEGFDRIGAAAAAPPAMPARPVPPPPGPVTLNMDGLGLMQESLLEEALAVDNIAGRARHAHRDALLRMAQYVAAEFGSRRVDIDALPIGPQALSRVFMEVCNQIEIQPHCRIVFTKLFTRFVIDKLAEFYDECLAALPTRDAVEAGSTEAATPVEQQAEALPTAVRADESAAAPAAEHKLDQAWDVSRTPLLAPPGKAPAMPRDLLDELLKGVQKQLLDRRKPLAQLNPKAGIRPLEVFELLNEGLHAMGYTRAAAVPIGDVETINLVTLLFEHALRDQQVPQPMRRLLRLLQVPVVRAALRDPDVLSQTSHPVRQLLKEMGTASIGWTPPVELGSDEFFRRMQSVVVRIINEFDRSMAVFEECLQSLHDFLKSERGRARLLEQRTLMAETGKAEAKAARDAIAELVRAATSSATLAPAVADFLRGPWSDALFVVRLQEGESGNAWQLAMETTARLVAVAGQSGAAPASFAAIAKGLKLGLLRLGLAESAVDAMLAELEAGTFSPGDTLDPAAAIAAPAVVEPKPAASEKFLQLVDKLPPDAWIEFHEPGKETLRARLLTKIPASGQYLFVNRAGAKAGEWSRNDLACAVEKGTAVIVSVPGGAAGAANPSSMRWGRR